MQQYGRKFNLYQWYTLIHFHTDIEINSTVIQIHYIPKVCNFFSEEFLMIVNTNRLAIDDKRFLSYLYVGFMLTFILNHILETNIICIYYFYNKNENINF